MKRSTIKREKIEANKNVNIKYVFYDYLYRILSRNQDISKTFFKYLFFLEFIQFYWLLLHKDLQIYDPSSFPFQYVQNALEYFNCHEKIGNLNSHLIALIFLTIIAIIYLIALFVTLNDGYKKGFRVQLATYLIPITGKLAPIPFLYIIGMTIMKAQNLTENFTTLFLVYFTVSFLIIWLIFLLCFHPICYYIKYPFCHSFIAKDNNHDEIFKNIFKIIFAVYHLIDNTFQFKLVYLIMALALLALYILFIRFHGNSFTYYDLSSQQFVIFLQAILVFQALVSLIAQLYPTVKLNQMFYLYSQLAIVLLSIGCIKIRILIDYRQIEKFLKKKLKESAYQTFVLNMIDKIFFEKNKSQASLIAIFKLIRSQILEICVPIPDPNNKRQQKLKLLKQLIIWIDEKKTKSFQIKSIKCFILSESGYTAASIMQSLQIESKRINFQGQFQMAYFRNLKNSFHEKYLMGKEKGQRRGNFQLLFEKNEKSILLESLIQQSVQNRIQLWKEITFSCNSLHKILSFSMVQKQLKKKIDQTYGQIEQLSNRQVNIDIAKLYLQFLRYCGSSKIKLIEMRQKLFIIFEKHKQNINKHIETGENWGKGITITLDLKDQNFGNIVNCNSQIKTALKYEKADLIGKNISVLMPKIFIIEHQNKIRNFLQNKKGDEVHQIKIYPLSKDMYFIEMSIKMKVVSSHTHGIMMVGLLEQVYNQFNSTPCFMVERSTETIRSVNRDFLRHLGKNFEGKLFNHQKIPAKTLFPEISIAKIVEKSQQSTYMQVTHLVPTMQDFSVSREGVKAKYLLTLYKSIKFGNSELLLIVLLDNRHRSSIMNNEDLQSPIKFRRAGISNNAQKFIQFSQFKKDVQFVGLQQNQLAEEDYSKQIEDKKDSLHRLFCFWMKIIISVYLLLWGGSILLLQEALLSFQNDMSEEVSDVALCFTISSQISHLSFLASKFINIPSNASQILQIENETQILNQLNSQLNMRVFQEENAKMTYNYNGVSLPDMSFNLAQLVINFQTFAIVPDENIRNIILSNLTSNQPIFTQFFNNITLSYLAIYQNQIRDYYENKIIVYSILEGIFFVWVVFSLIFIHKIDKMTINIFKVCEHLPKEQVQMITKSSIQFLRKILGLNEQNYEGTFLQNKLKVQKVSFDAQEINEHNQQAPLKSHYFYEEKKIQKRETCNFHLQNNNIGKITPSRVICILILIAFIIASTTSLAILEKNYLKGAVMDKFQRLMKIGKLSSELRSIQFYAIQSLIYNDILSNSLLSNYTIQFYDEVQKLFPLTQASQNILSLAYNSIEAINQVALAKQYPSSLRTPENPALQELSQVFDQEVPLFLSISNDFQDNLSIQMSQLDLFNTLCILMGVGIFVSGGLCLYCCLIRRPLIISNKSVCLLEVLPVDILRKLPLSRL